MDSVLRAHGLHSHRFTKDIASLVQQTYTQDLLWAASGLARGWDTRGRPASRPGRLITQPQGWRAGPLEPGMGVKRFCGDSAPPVQTPCSPFATGSPHPDTPQGCLMQRVSNGTDHPLQTCTAPTFPMPADHTAVQRLEAHPTLPLFPTQVHWATSPISSSPRP